MDLNSLLEKLHEGNISVEELGQLIALLKNDDLLQENLNEIWKITSDKGIDERTIQNQFEIISNKIKEKTPNHNIEVNKKALKSTLFEFVKYAAVLFLGFLAAWLIYSGGQYPVKTSSLENGLHVIQVANGSKSTILLPDGSKVNLNSGSRLTYSAMFGITNRNLALEGEGFFEVAKNKALPLYVKTRQITVKALGTSFNVKSYNDDDISETTLIEGKIEIYQNNPKQTVVEKSMKLAELRPNEIAVVSKNTVKLDKITTNKIERVEKKSAKIQIEKSIKPELNTEWKENILVFDNERFAEIIKKLERWYNVEISLEYKKLSQIRFTGKFDRESVEDVMDALRLIENFTYKKEKNKIVIYNKANNEN